MVERIENINWKLLREQKLVLLEILAGRKLTKRRKRGLEGIVSLIDALQDETAKELGEKEVFGKL